MGEANTSELQRYRRYIEQLKEVDRDRVQQMRKLADRITSLLDEIERLRAELQKAESERDEVGFQLDALRKVLKAKGTK